MFEKDFKYLYQEFLKIQKLGWVQGISNGNGNAGRTLEFLLGKKEPDRFPVPDYDGIEIKTQLSNSKYCVALFSLVPDGEDLFEIRRLTTKYGYPTNEFSNSRSLWAIVDATHYEKIGNFYQFKLRVDYDERRIYLQVYNRGKLIDSQTYWTFNSIETRLYTKLNFLAFVRVESKISNGNKFFQYLSIDFFRLKSFEEFVKLLDLGIIQVQIKVGVYKDAQRYGKIYDHGTAFQISPEHFDLLFHSVDIENTDFQNISKL